MTLAPKNTLDGAARREPGNTGSPAVQEAQFVINLCPVAVPITMPQPRSPHLTRFKFFLSQCWEDSRKRYRLHMGYFPTLAEAEKWLNILRGIYPGAFVSEASAAPTDLLSDTQVLRILEQHRADGVGGGTDETVAREIPSLRPNATSTRLAPRDGAIRDARDSFAVQRTPVYEGRSRSS